MFETLFAQLTSPQFASGTAAIYIAGAIVAILSFVLGWATRTLGKAPIVETVQAKQLSEHDAVNYLQQIGLPKEILLDKLIQNLPVALFAKDVKDDYRWIVCNTKAEALFGLKPEQIIGLKDWDLFNKEEAAAIRAIDLKVMAEGKVVDVPIQRVTTPQGAFFAHVVKVPIYDEKGRPHILLGIFEDITAKMKTEEKLRLFERVVSHSSSGFMVTDVRDDTVLYINPAFTKLTGYAEEAVIGTSASKLLADSTHRQEKLYDSDEDTQSVGAYSGVYMGTNSDGTLYWRSYDTFSVPDESGMARYTVTVQRDISKLKEQEEKLKKAVVAADAANQAKSLFLANMSHEIRTPMNGIIGTASLIMDTGLTEKQREYVSVIDGSARALLDIITDILDFSKIEANQITLQSEAFDLIASLKDQIRLMTPVASQQNLSLQVNIDPRIPPYVMGDETRIRQIIINLVGNALKFTTAGGIYITATLLSGEEEGPVVIKVSVKDTGIGIPKDKQSQLFNPFYQVSSGTTKTMGGTGLGLAICRKFCHLMDGDIGVESDTGQGTTFWFTASLRRPSEQQIVSARKEFEEKAQKQEVRFGELHVLVVEDVATNQFVIKNILDSLGCTYDVAANGEEAVERQSQTRYDVILMDCHMPVMDGFEAALRIKQGAGKDVPIIALTANAMKEDREKSLAAGMNDFISKPIDKQDLIRLFNKWFAR